MLKDHSVFQHEGAYYLVSIRVELPSIDGRGERVFAYARTMDFCTWDDLGDVLGPGPSGSADEEYIWAPHVIKAGSDYHMFYTGVNRHGAQSIMLAVTDTPEAPDSWRKHGVVFRPNHPGMVYPGPQAWSDARDPMILKDGDTYRLYYTGLDVGGGIIGLATSSTLTGTWTDAGAMLVTPGDSMPESAFVFEHAGGYYLFYNEAWGRGPLWRWSVAPAGPWGEPVPVLYGWAHEFLHAHEVWLATYVFGSGEAIGMLPVAWEARNTPPAPVIGVHTRLPVMHSPSGTAGQAGAQPMPTTWPPPRGSWRSAPPGPR